MNYLSRTRCDTLSDPGMCVFRGTQKADEGLWYIADFVQDRLFNSQVSLSVVNKTTQLFVGLDCIPPFLYLFTLNFVSSLAAALAMPILLSTLTTHAIKLSRTTVSLLLRIWQLSTFIAVYFITNALSSVHTTAYYAA